MPESQRDKVVAFFGYSV